MIQRITLYFSILFLTSIHAQITNNFVELRVKNDNAGEMSNILNTGDDLGETHSSRIVLGLLKIHPVYNFRLTLESTEYSKLNSSTSQPRDILFTELNNFQFAFDNNKFQSNTFFFSAAIGMYYIQDSRITIGATGQKYNLHKSVLNKIYFNKYWVYSPSTEKDYYITYAEGKYGMNKLLFKKEHLSLNNINNLELRIAGNYHFSGIGARTYFDLKWSNEKFKMHAIDFEFEGYYLTNFKQSQIAYLQLGSRINFKHLLLYWQLNKPIKKYLANPYTKYDDMELLFNYGLVYLF